MGKVKKSHWGIIGLSAVLVLGGGAVAVNAAIADPAPAVVVVDSDPARDAVLIEREAQRVADAEAAAAEVARIAAEAQAVVDAQAAADAAQAAAEAQAEQEAQAQREAAEPEVTGDEVGWVESVDPNNREGGDWDTAACPSGRFMTGPNGTPLCQP